ncbi:GntR family transcriptional regulator [Marinobacterium rhizophilum]|uniref:GntR family transcriptional regulator n=1 Tax=Marinobacterium rhizophilum TaxID=420402 RepID=A0ABY5HGU7_9GAMM|nr:GntR family transcriptional regulator [Marinobacterium rhizophilum]UTW10191.1 GntR family transcriptional regulator [Marinobacterium rhizophilum]
MSESNQPLTNDIQRDSWARLGPLTLQEGATAQSLVYATLRHALISGYFRPGEEISLRKAAAVLETSVTPVREALRRLEGDGGLETFGGNRVLRVPILTDAELLDIRDIRLNLEGFAAVQAIKNIGPAQMRVINNAFNLMDLAAQSGDVDMYLENNWRFHSLIYRAADRPILMSQIEGLWLRVGPLIHIAVASPMHFDQSMDAHSAALQALRDSDGDALQQAIIRDISEAACDLRQTLRNWEAQKEQHSRRGGRSSK